MLPARLHASPSSMPKRPVLKRPVLKRPVLKRPVLKRPVLTRPVLKQLGRSRPVRALGAEVLGAYLRFTFATTRWQLHATPELRKVMADTPCVFAFWHERLLLMSFFWMHASSLKRGGGAPLHVLISANRDGQLYSAVMRRLGASVVTGSRAKGRDQKGGAAGLRAMLGILKGGGQVVVTPDGPRGPAHQAAPGAAHLAALAGVPLVPMSAGASRVRRLGSWDRTVVPLPFGRGVLVCGTPLLVPRASWAEAVPTIEAALNAVQRRADALLAPASC